MPAETNPRSGGPSGLAATAQAVSWAATRWTGNAAVLAEQPSGRLDGREDGGRDTDRLGEVARPGARRDVQQAGRPGVRPLADGLAGQLVGDKLRQHQQPVRARSSSARSCAASWKIVLIGISWTPVRR